MLVVRQYRISNSPDKITEKALPHGDLVQLKTYKLIVACLLEDFVQSNLQFFYIEKFLIDESLIVYVNSALMLAIYLWYGYQLIILLVENDFTYSRRACFIVAQGIIAGIYPISRIFGAIHQMRRKDGKIVGACVRYNYADQTLAATPFRFDCLIGNDYVLLISSGFTVLGIFGYQIYLSTDSVFKKGKFSLHLTSLYSNTNNKKIWRVVYWYQCGQVLLQSRD